jgi:hypothetical protein
MQSGRGHLDALVSANLVVVIPSPGVSGYALLETIRFYAGSKLVEAGEHLATHDRHMHHYIAENEAMADGSYDRNRFGWSLRNMISAVDHGLDTGSDAAAIEAFSFWAGMMEAGSESGERRRMRAREAAERVGGVPRMLIDYLDIEAAAFRGRYDDVEAHAKQFLTDYSQSDMSQWTRYRIYQYLLSWLALAVSCSNPGRAESLCDEIDGLDPDYFARLQVAQVRSSIAVARGDLERAHAQLTNAGAEVDPMLACDLMIVLHLLGRSDEAAALLPSVPEVTVVLGPVAQAIAAIVCEWSGAPAEAQRRLEVSLRSAQPLGPLHQRSALIALAAVLAHRGDAERAWPFIAAATRSPGIRLPVEVALANHHLPIIESAIDPSRLAELQEMTEGTELSVVLADAIRFMGDVVNAQSPARGSG